MVLRLCHRGDGADDSKPTEGVRDIHHIDDETLHEVLDDREAALQRLAHLESGPDAEQAQKEPPRLRPPALREVAVRPG
jgi:hypothetical protein